MQDTWYATPNLTVTYGLRADKPDASPSPTFNECFAAAPGAVNAACGNNYRGGFGLDNTSTYSDSYNLQPRLGFNYSFDTERATQLRGGVGLFQGDAPQVWIGNAYSASGLNSMAYTNVTAWQQVPFSANGLDQPTQELSTLPGSASRNVNVISPDFELPSVWKANLTFDHELPWGGIVASSELFCSPV